MRAHPALQCPEAPEHDSFAHTEEGCKNENCKSDCPESKAQRRAAHAAMVRRLLYEPWWQTKSGGQTPRMKIANVNPGCRNGGEHDKNQPRNVRAIKNPHDERLSFQPQSGVAYHGRAKFLPVTTERIP